MPGHGWSCPIVVGGKVFVTSGVTDAKAAAPKTGYYTPKDTKTHDGKEVWKTDRNEKSNYLREADGPLDGYALASRLSFFLGSSMPDEQLLALARASKLTDSAILRKQVDRMLDDPRSAAFVRRFMSRWLQLYKLGTMPPLGGFYYHPQMEGEMLKQTDAFFAHLLRENRPIREVIDSDYTFLNERVSH